MIKGKRINLRPITQEDLPEMVALENNVAESGPYSDPHLSTLPRVKKRFEEHGYWSKDHGTLLITDKEDVLLGYIKHFKGIIYAPGYELGAMIYEEKNRSKGYITEALTLYSAYLFDVFPIERLELATSIDNIGAQMVAKKCGFVFEGIMRKGCHIRGKLQDLHRYSLLREEAPDLSSLLSSFSIK